MARIKVSPVSRKNIRNIAREFRKIFGIENDLYIDIVCLLELALVNPGIIEYEIVEDSEMGYDEALSIPADDLLLIKESVYEGAAAGNPRDRFTIAHEIGHLILHKDYKNCFARTESNVKPYEDPEWQANCFAGEFLVPYHLCKNMSTDEIALRCGVSKKAAEVQKSTFKYRE